MTDAPQRICPGCRASLDRTSWALDRDLRASPECWHAYGQIATFERTDPSLAARHQLAWDTYTAQHAGSPSPPVTVASALVGLDLALRCGVDGAAVSGAQMRIGSVESWWPAFEPPPAPGPVTVLDVLRDGAKAGSVPGHAAALDRWAASVWQSWAGWQDEIAALVTRLFPGEFGRR